MAILEKNEQVFCEKCRKSMRADEFYKSNNLEKYPTGKLNQCKKCLTMKVDNWNPQTYLWILQEADVPYIPDEWNKLLSTHGKDPKKVSGTTIIGRYLAKMQLKQFRDYRWADTTFLQEVADKRTEEAMKRQGFSAVEIAQVINTGKINIPEQGFEIPKENFSETPQVPNYPYAETEDYFNNDTIANDDLDQDLTEEDKKYLRIKWGKTYKPEDWIKLEQLYKEMEKSYDIQGAGHEDVLKLVCKTSLKANKLLDIDDVDGSQKMVKMYDSLMKSGKFTAAQNKKDDGEFLNSISEFVAMCEKDGFIPRYYTEGPKDRVDETIQDLKDYTRSLVIEEMNLGNLIENAVKEMAALEAKEEDEDTDDEELSVEELEAMRDEDFYDYNSFIEEESEEDEELMKKESGGKG